MNLSKSYLSALGDFVWGFLRWIHESGPAVTS